jgi:hypothetical protein
MFDSRRPDTTTEHSEPITQIRCAVTALTRETREGWLGSMLSERLVELLEARERLDAEILRLTAQWDHNQAWEIDGALSPRAWLTHRGSLTNHEAGKLVKQARLLREHHTLAAALGEGTITTAHVDTISRVVSNDRETLLEEHAPTLVEQAQNLSLPDFGLMMRQWASLADDQLAKDEFAQKWQRRHLHASVGLDGWVTGDFYLDPTAGAQLLTALDHLAPPDPEDAPDGPRTLSQRRADALTDLTNHYLNGGRPSGNPPNINTIIDVAALLGQTPDMATTRCEIEGIGPVTKTVLNQICCNARFTRFIMAGPSQILDMGRAVRFPTRAQRRAVTIRDRHCQFPGCNRKPQWCDIHHIDGWIESLGPTNINNLILLCRRHHTLIHNSRWAIKRTADGDYEFIHPARGP